MGQKIKKKDILDEIKAEIDKCLAYQKADPDKTAQKRVENMAKNPCNTKKFFVNVTLKNPEIAQTEKMSERLKRVKVKRYLATLDEMKKIFEAGCIIEVTVNKNAPISINVTSHNCYASLMCSLIPKYFDESCMLMTLKPKKSTTSNSYIEDDVNTALNAGKKKIVYAMGRFSLNGIKDLVKEEYDTEKFDIYSFELNNMKNVAYVDMTRRTSLEQNVNQFFQNVGVMNSVTMFGAKSNLPSFDLKKAHAVYDMCTYINLKMNEVKAGDDAQAQKKYKFYSETRDEVFRDKLEARHKAFQSFGGSWSDWNAAESQFLTFKAVSSYDKDFLKEAESNSSFMNSVLAYEKTSALYGNSLFPAIKESWKQETDFFKKKCPCGIEFEEEYSGEAKSAATAFVNANMVDPPTVVVEPYGCSKIKFNENIYYKFCVPAQLGISEEEYALKEVKDPRYPLLGDSKNVYAKVNGFFKSKNTIPIKRDTIKLEYLDYQYTGVDMELDKDNNAPYEDEFTHEGMKFTVPAKSYYNAAERVYFDSQQLDDRFKFCQLRYEIIPKVVSLPYVFIQDSSFEALAKAEEREKQVREDWKDKFLRCCVDAINYDPWMTVIERLKKLFCIWAKLGAEDEELIELPPIELTDMTGEICEKCGKEKNECTCDEMKLCTKCYPLDLYGMSGKLNLGRLVGDKDASIYGLFTATGYMYDQANHPLTFAEIAKEIYSAVYMRNMGEVIPIELFATMTQYSLSVLSITYPMLQACTQFQISGTTANKFSRENWENFVKEYSIGLSSGKNMDSIKYSLEFKVGVTDGYAYIPTGYSVSFEYNPQTYQFNIKGATSAQTALLMTLAACSEEQYKVMWKSVAKACEPLSDDMKKFIAYPYMPSVKSIIDGLADKIENPDELDENYIYIPDPSDISISTSGLSSGVIQVRFSIYIKRPVLCSYPKNKVPTCRTKNTEGFCGLRELFEKPLIVCPYNFELEKEILKRETRKKRIKMKKISQDLKENTQFVKDAACNVTKNLQRIDDIQNAAMAQVIDFSNSNRDLLGMVGRDQTNGENQESVLCEAILNQKLKSIMVDYDQVFNQTAGLIELIGDESFDKTKEAIADIVKDFITINNSLKKSLIEIAASFPIFMICNKKYNDYLTEQNLPKPLDVDLIELAKEEYLNDMNQNITARIGNNVIRENVMKISDLKTSAQDDVIESIKRTNFDEIKSLIGIHKPLQAITGEGNTEDEKAMILVRKECKCSGGKAKLKNAIKKESCSSCGNSSCSCKKTLKEKFANPKNLCDGLTLATDIAKCAGKMTGAITNGISSGIQKTAEEVIYPLFGLSVPQKNDAQPNKNSLMNCCGMNEKIAMAQKAASSMKNAQEITQTAKAAMKNAQETTQSSVAQNAMNMLDSYKEMLAASACSTVVATIMSSCGTYLNSAGIGAAALGGIAGVLEGSGDVKTDAISGVNQLITGLLNTAIEKTGLKEILKTTIDGVVSAASKIIPGIGSGQAVEGAKNITENLPKNVGGEIANNLDDAVNESVAKKLNSMKELVKSTPALNEIVSSILKKGNEETSNTMMGFCNGSSSFNIEKQNNDATKKTLENDSCNSDALTQVYKFIKDNTKLWQQLTGEFITFDSIK